MKFSAAVSCLLLPWVAQGHEGHGRHLQKEKTPVRPDAPVLSSSPGPESPSGVHRCGTRELPSESVVKAMEAIAAERVKGGAARRLKGFSATIPVVFHLISDDGTMYTTSEKMDAQIDVLNEAFAAAGFTFELVKTTFTTNPDWFVEDDYFNMVQTLREGCKQTLNVYWYDIPGKTLTTTSFWMAFQFFKGLNLVAVLPLTTKVTLLSTKWDTGKSHIYTNSAVCLRVHPF